MVGGVEKMRIAFDATAILGPMRKKRGIGNYSMGQFTTMIKNDKKNEPQKHV